ncbi:hypothetical protein BgiBS90_009223 [Biomphalaria glabrata]|nr:hypothetical protein BgiBS90_009223 [Biomphalaria glabrata]
MRAKTAKNINFCLLRLPVLPSHEGQRSKEIWKGFYYFIPLYSISTPIKYFNIKEAIVIYRFIKIMNKVRPMFSR